MFYGCKFHVAKNCAVLTADLITSAQRELEGAKEALYAQMSYCEDESPNVGFAVIFLDEDDFESYGLFLHESFLDDASSKRIRESLEMKFI